MRILLDSMAAIMWWTDADRLGERARAVLEGEEGDVHLSAVSVWEVANKNRIGKLDMIVDFPGQFGALVDDNAWRLLDLTPAHAMRAGYLLGSHRDPFDRLLAGQALVEDMTVLTNIPSSRRSVAR